MTSISLGDEVRFAMTPDIIDYGNLDQYPAYVRTKSPRERKLRMRVIVNEKGQIQLDLSGYELRNLPSEVFNFVRVEVLKIAENQLQTIPSGISHLHKLRVLDAHSNSIQALPDTLVNCIHLQELDLSRNKLSSLPQHISSLRNLRMLKLGHNRFENLPHELGDVENLRHLELNSNKLWHLPYSIQHLNHLRHLNLADNSFDQVPIAICSLKNLENLDLGGNKLINLPPDFESLKYLKKLNLASNKLETLPYVVSHLKGLSALDISHNKLNHLPPRVAKIPKLRTLLVQGNNIATLPNNLTTITHLNVADNKMKNFSVAKLRHLKYLNANSNYLENLPLGVCNLSSLEILKLNSNKISYISQDIVLLKRLKTLDLGNNKLVTLPQVINELDNLEVFNIRGNKFQNQGSKYAATMAGTTGTRSTRQLNNRRQAPRSNHDYYMDQSTRYEKDNRKKVNQANFHKESDPGYGGNYTPRSTGKKPKTKRKKRFFFSMKKSKPSGRKYPPHSHKGTQWTQYTPRTTKTRSRPPLDYTPKTESIISFSFPRTKQSQRSRRTFDSTVFSGTLPKTIPKSEQSVPTSYKRSIKTARTMDNRNLYTHQWINDRGKAAPPSVISNAATANETVGDCLSLGEADHEFQPTTITDYRLLGVCDEVEVMLNKQLLRPIISPPKGIFRKSINEVGTLRTLNGITNGSLNKFDGDQSNHSHTATLASPTGTIRMSDDVFLKSPPSLFSNGLLRTRMDNFQVTGAGGMFHSSTDPNIKIYFPVNAVDFPMIITMQVEKVEPDALQSAKKQDPIIDNIISMGHIVHISQSVDVDFNEQVALTIPAPPSVGQTGKLQVLTHKEDNTCTPCTSGYKLFEGYITVQAWHFSGKGAVLTKGKCKYKACKSVERLLQYFYV